MDFANHIHDLTEVVDPTHRSNVLEFFETRKSHRGNVWTNICIKCVAFKKISKLFRKISERAHRCAPTLFWRALDQHISLGYQSRKSECVCRKNKSIYDESLNEQSVQQLATSLMRKRNSKYDLKQTWHTQKIIHCRNGRQTTAITFYFQCFKQLVRNVQSHVDLYKKKCLAKTWLRFLFRSPWSYSIETKIWHGVCKSRSRFEWGGWPNPWIQPSRMLWQVKATEKTFKSPKNMSH